MYSRVHTEAVPWVTVFLGDWAQVWIVTRIAPHRHLTGLRHGTRLYKMDGIPCKASQSQAVPHNQCQASYKHCQRGGKGKPGLRIPLYQPAQPQPSSSFVPYHIDVSDPAQYSQIDDVWRTSTPCGSSQVPASPAMVPALLSISTINLSGLPISSVQQREEDEQYKVLGNLEN